MNGININEVLESYIFRRPYISLKWYCLPLLHISLIMVAALLKCDQDRVIIDAVNSLYPFLVHVLETNFTNQINRGHFF